MTTCSLTHMHTNTSALPSMFVFCPACPLAPGDVCDVILRSWGNTLRLVRPAQQIIQNTWHTSNEHKEYDGLIFPNNKKACLVWHGVTVQPHHDTVYYSLVSSLTNLSPGPLSGLLEILWPGTKNMSLKYFPTFIYLFGFEIADCLKCIPLCNFHGCTLKPPP